MGISYFSEHTQIKAFANWTILSASWPPIDLIDKTIRAIIDWEARLLPPHGSVETSAVEACMRVNHLVLTYGPCLVLTTQQSLAFITIAFTLRYDFDFRTRNSEILYWKTSKSCLIVNKYSIDFINDVLL